jgi:hypothetical protein
LECFFVACNILATRLGYAFQNVFRRMTASWARLIGCRSLEEIKGEELWSLSFHLPDEELEFALCILGVGIKSSAFRCSGGLDVAQVPILHGAAKEDVDAGNSGTLRLVGCHGVPQLKVRVVPVRDTHRLSGALQADCDRLPQTIEPKDDASVSVVDSKDTSILGKENNVAFMDGLVSDDDMLRRNRIGRKSRRLAHLVEDGNFVPHRSEDNMVRGVCDASDRPVTHKREQCFVPVLKDTNPSSLRKEL